MKFAKKMKLIEIDNDNIAPHANSNCINDEEYPKPHVLSPLDNIMNKILKAPFISDGEKWSLYNQALQRYLNHVKIATKKIDYNNTSYSENRGKDDYNSSPAVEDTFNLSMSPLDISGLAPLRDSLDSISQPVVRNFFERARNTSAVPLFSQPVVDQPSLPKEPTKRKARKSQPRRILPYNNTIYYTRSKCVSSKKRRAENSLSADLSQVRPCKVILNRWLPSTAR